MALLKDVLFDLHPLVVQAWGSVVLTRGVVVLGVILITVLGFVGASFNVWLVCALISAWFVGASDAVFYSLFGLFIVFSIPIVRARLLSYPMMVFMKAMKFLPVISQTEKTAIEAGSVWMDAELFSGRPNFKLMLDQTYAQLTASEQAFLDGPVETVCQMVDDWAVHQKRDFPQEVWDYLKKEKFFGMIIDPKYGGLGFSAIANSAVVAKLSSRSTPLGITVMVPNSLGPAELLSHYGTPEQKSYYLPRLADGREVPCFALTEPAAGSDAGAITSYGVVFKDKEGKTKIRLVWKKRYITLAAISTVIGLAFKLQDPDNILGKGDDLGITCALIPSSTSGVILGKRHDPLGVPFYNCPTEGHNVEIAIDQVIGGVRGVGKGWQMLMESLSAGRGISLPANCTGGVKFVSRVVSAYSYIRKQFGLSIGKFEGIEEPVARMAGYSYLLEAARCYTCGALDDGAKPAVVTAIAKYHFTEIFREVINDGMDVLGGAAISMGPRNLLAHPYFATPISITVEGANILTRTLMIFGQGAIRCHPYALKEIQALEKGDVRGFDRAFWGHVGHVVRNFFRSVVLYIFRGRLSSSPVSGSTKRYYQKLSWASAQFAFFSDVAMATLGGQLKRREKLTGRFGDILSWMYLGFSVLRRFEAEGRRREDRPFVDWCMALALSEIQKGFEGVFSNMGFGTRVFGFLIRLNPFSLAPSDDLGGQIAKLIQVPGEIRDRLTDGIFVPEDPTEGLGRYEKAFAATYATESLSKRVLAAVKSGKLKRERADLLIQSAVSEEILTDEEALQLTEAEKLRRDAIQVDDFTLDDYLKRTL